MVAVTDTAEERDGCSGVSKVVVASGIDVIASERGAPLQPNWTLVGYTSYVTLVNKKRT